MIRRKGPSRDRGFTLIEVVLATVLLGIFALLASELFVVCYRTGVASNRRSDSIQRMDSLLGQLRRDVWAARTLAADGKDLVTSDGVTTVRWTTDPARGLVRTDQETRTQRAWSIPAALRFEVAGPVLTVHVADGKQDESVTLISQVLLAGGAK